MASTTFIDGVTQVVAAWANDVNTTTYTTVPSLSTTVDIHTTQIATKAAAGANTDITSLASPTIAGATATTQSPGDNTTKVATTAFVTTAVSAITTPTIIPVRQTVLSGPVDSNGFSAFGGSTGTTTVTASGSLIPTASNGFGSTGQIDRVGSITNPSWTNLSTNGTMYLYLDIASNGTCTPGSTTLAPIYKWGGTYSTTNNQFTFNIQEMTGKVGNGTTATQIYRVFVGSVTVASGVVSAIVWYALMGRYQSGYTNTLPGGSSSVSRNHNLGTTFVKTGLRVKCLTSEGSYAVGEIENAPWRQSGSSNSSIIVPTVQTELAMRFSTGNSLAIGGFDPTNGGAFAMTNTSWAYELWAERSW